ncbi:hypothetical protein MP228_000191 [Amoeboaphelidium protococcarum]|nr:hypothetical protein MP228_000191 [Amoeboaphelidium protococcarum]
MREDVMAEDGRTDNRLLAKLELEHRIPDSTNNMSMSEDTKRAPKYICTILKYVLHNVNKAEELRANLSLIIPPLLRVLDDFHQMSMAEETLQLFLSKVINLGEESDYGMLLLKSISQWRLQNLLADTVVQHLISCQNDGRDTLNVLLQNIASLMHLANVMDENQLYQESPHQRKKLVDLTQYQDPRSQLNMLRQKLFEAVIGKLQYMTMSSAQSRCMLIQHFSVIVRDHLKEDVLYFIDEIVQVSLDFMLHEQSGAVSIKLLSWLNKNQHQSIQRKLDQILIGTAQSIQAISDDSDPQKLLELLKILVNFAQNQSQMHDNIRAIGEVLPILNGALKDVSVKEQ